MQHLHLRHFTSIWCKLNVLMSFTGSLRRCLGVKWSNVSIYTIRLIYEPVIVMEALLFSSLLSLKFIAPLKCVCTRVLTAGRSDTLGVCL